MATTRTTAKWSCTTEETHLLVAKIHANTVHFSTVSPSSKKNLLFRRLRRGMDFFFVHNMISHRKKQCCIMLAVVVWWSIKKASLLWRMSSSTRVVEQCHNASSTAFSSSFVFHFHFVCTYKKSGSECRVETRSVVDGGVRWAFFEMLAILFPESSPRYLVETVYNETRDTEIRCTGFTVYIMENEYYGKVLKEEKAGLCEHIRWYTRRGTNFVARWKLDFTIMDKNNKMPCMEKKHWWNHATMKLKLETLHLFCILWLGWPSRPCSCPVHNFFENPKRYKNRCFYTKTTCLAPYR